MLQPGRSAPLRHDRVATLMLLLCTVILVESRTDVCKGTIQPQITPSAQGQMWTLTTPLTTFLTAPGQQTCVFTRLEVCFKKFQEWHLSLGPSSNASFSVTVDGQPRPDCLVDISGAGFLAEAPTIDCFAFGGCSCLFLGSNSSHGLATAREVGFLPTTKSRSIRKTVCKGTANNTQTGAAEFLRTFLYVRMQGCPLQANQVANVTVQWAVRESQDTRAFCTAVGDGIKAAVQVVVFLFACLALVLLFLFVLQRGTLYFLPSLRSGRDDRGFRRFLRKVDLYFDFNSGVLQVTKPEGRDRWLTVAMIMNVALMLIMMYFPPALRSKGPYEGAQLHQVKFNLKRIASRVAWDISGTSKFGTFLQPVVLLLMIILFSALWGMLVFNSLLINYSVRVTRPKARGREEAPGAADAEDVHALRRQAWKVYYGKKWLSAVCMAIADSLVLLFVVVSYLESSSWYNPAAYHVLLVAVYGTRLVADYKYWGTLWVERKDDNIARRKIMTVYGPGGAPDTTQPTIQLHTAVVDMQPPHQPPQPPLQPPPAQQQQLPLSQRLASLRSVSFDAKPPRHSPPQHQQSPAKQGGSKQVQEAVQPPADVPAGGMLQQLARGTVGVVRASHRWTVTLWPRIHRSLREDNSYRHSAWFLAPVCIAAVLALFFYIKEAYVVYRLSDCLNLQKSRDNACPLLHGSQRAYLPIIVSAANLLLQNPDPNQALQQVTSFLQSSQAFTAFNGLSFNPTYQQAINQLQPIIGKVLECDPAAITQLVTDQAEALLTQVSGVDLAALQSQVSGVSGVDLAALQQQLLQSGTGSFVSQLVAAQLAVLLPQCQQLQAIAGALPLLNMTVGGFVSGNLQSLLGTAVGGAGNLPAVQGFQQARGVLANTLTFMSQLHSAFRIGGQVGCLIGLGVALTSLLIIMATYKRAVRQIRRELFVGAIQRKSTSMKQDAVDLQLLVNQVKGSSLFDVIFFYGVVFSTVVLQLFLVSAIFTVIVTVLAHPRFWSAVLPTLLGYSLAIFLSQCITVFVIGWVIGERMAPQGRIGNVGLWLFYFLTTQFAYGVLGWLVALLRIVLVVLSALLLVCRIDRCINLLGKGWDPAYKSFLAMMNMHGQLRSAAELERGLLHGVAINWGEDEGSGGDDENIAPWRRVRRQVRRRQLAERLAAGEMAQQQVEVDIVDDDSSDDEPEPAPPSRGSFGRKVQRSGSALTAERQSQQRAATTLLHKPLLQQGDEPGSVLDVTGRLETGHGPHSI